MALLGVIADDFTGATDIAGMLVKAGMRTVQTIGVPDAAMPLDDIDAIVVALKSRTIAAPEAVTLSLDALGALQRRGCRQFFFKYCSTFDSTDAGNIGPVADALLDALASDFTIFCPAFPANARAIFNGYLFVGPVLLSESGMRHHPLTPMTDPSLVRVLQRQTARTVGLIPLGIVQGGAEAIRAEIARLRGAGIAHAVVDAVADADLLAIGTACAELPLVTGGSGVSMGLPANFRRAGLLPASDSAAALPAAHGHAAILAGSCSTATLGQIADFEKHGAALHLDTRALCEGRDVVGPALAWARARLGDKPVLLSSSDTPDAVKALQAAFGVEASSQKIEAAMAALARGLAEAGVGRLVVAGGETSGAVVSALGVRALRIGAEIDPGVPWTSAATSDGKTVALALKSGNFGAADFFTKAFTVLS
ncbi:four-carbon acid sugar kinase family protein [Vineibacter terrae]|uniref:3-oxo-tetronate kinase n=1 Tax=Vineibacter terrae TaxID=2586908 RepID=A0A5C8P7P5_9HYPH|nr:3-oxo-tetronate kinase [Vineibacter terrae]TXL69781.1 four-carbon acid sugar kinase family protein [Vineibacter terrae]